MSRPALPMRRRRGRKGCRTNCSRCQTSGYGFCRSVQSTGSKIAAALWQPLAKPAASTTLLVQVHGSGGNLASVQLRATARTLSARGYAALSISTRQHDEHVNTDNFFEIRRDIEAAIATAKALGYRAIVLQGQSLGTAQVAFYAATDWDPAIKGVILTGAIAKPAVESAPHSDPGRRRLPGAGAGSRATPCVRAGRRRRCRCRCAGSADGRRR